MEPIDRQMSEGYCPKCGFSLGISGQCTACAIEERIEGSKPAGPTCAQCAAPMLHFRLRGYECSINNRHKGIIWPKRETQNG